MENPAPPVEPTVQPPHINELQTRFLYPFFFDRNGAALAAHAVCRDQIVTPDGKCLPLWHNAEARHYYKDEFLEHVVNYLFGPENRQETQTPYSKDCIYLQIASGQSGDPAQPWFRDATVELPSRHHLPVRFVPELGVELFLSTQGVAILSIALTPSTSRPLEIIDALEFNYRLSQFRRKPITGISKAHPSDDPARWAKIPAADRAKIRSRPAPDASLEERLMLPGGQFNLRELVQRLLQPLGEFHLKPVEPREMSVYTVVRLTDTDFSAPAVRRALAPRLSALAQIEEGEHAGSGPGELGVGDVVLNRRHWAAVGVLGAAHLVADQTREDGTPHPFNELRVQIAMEKYFVSYLTASLQRLTLNRAADEAGQIFAAPPDQRAERTAQLRQDLLRFGVGGHFNQISSRHAHHRFYQLCRESMDIVPAWQEFRQVLQELDSDQIARKQVEAEERLGEVAGQMKRSLDKITKIQELVHVIEYVLVAVYADHLCHMLLAENHHLRDHLGGFLHVDGEWALSICVGLFAVLGLVFVQRWDRHRKRMREKKRKPQSTK